MAFYFDANGPDYDAIAQAILNTDLSTFTGPENSLGAFLRNQVLTVPKFLGLQHMPALADLPLSPVIEVIHPFRIIDDANNPVVDDAANLVVWALYGPVVDDLENPVVDDLGRAVIVNTGGLLGNPVYDTAGNRVVDDAGNLVWGYNGYYALDNLGNIVVNDNGVPVTL
jgi:hypothetical protein